MKVEIPDSAGNGTDYELVDGVLSVNSGFTGSISAEYEFTTSPTREIDFEYDHNGLRTQKKVVENGITTTYDYTLHGKLITHLTKRTVNEEGIETEIDELHFFYDAQSRPAFVEYNSVKYRYVHNLQGDVVAILDSAGNPVVEYKYNIWGEITGIFGDLKDSIGVINLFRYRCYPWDDETKSYYLRSRMYLPELSRFIASDRLPEKHLPGTPFDRNQFAYCFNDPNDFIDPNGSLGFLAGLFIGGIVNTVVNIAVDYIFEENFEWSWGKAAKYFVEGAFVGGAGKLFSGASLIAKTANTVTGTIAAMEVSYLNYAHDCVTSEREFSTAGLAITMVYDGATSLIGTNSGIELLDATLGDTTVGLATGVANKAVVEPIVDNVVTPVSNANKTKTNNRAASKGPIPMPYLKTVYDPLLGKSREIVCYS